MLSPDSWEGVMNPREVSVLTRTNHIQKPAVTNDARQREGGAMFRLSVVRKVGLLAALLVSVGAYASDDLSYNYVEAEYLYLNRDYCFTCFPPPETGPNGRGFQLRGSVEVGSNVHIFAGYADIDFNTFSGIDSDVKTWTAGVGYHRDVHKKPKHSFFGEVGYVDVNLDSDVGDVSDDGVSAAIGFRYAMLSRHTVSSELIGHITYVDPSIEARDHDTAFGVDLLVNVSDTVSLGVGFSVSGDVDEAYSAGVRAYWGK
jgi:hypothetical protein